MQLPINVEKQEKSLKKTGLRCMVFQKDMKTKNFNNFNNIFCLKIYQNNIKIYQNLDKNDTF